MFNTPTTSTDAPASRSEKARHIADFLQSQFSGVLCTVDPQGEPHGAVIYYAADDHFSIVFSTKSGTRKSDNLQRHDRLSFVVYDVSSQTTLEIQGVAEEMTEVHEAQTVFASIFKISEQHSEVHIPPVAKLMAGSYVAYRVRPVRISMAVFARPAAGDPQTIYEVLEGDELR